MDVLNWRRVRVFGAGVLLGLLLGCGRQAAPEGYFDNTVNDAYFAVLNFEKESQQASKPCFSSVENKEYDPYETLGVCREALGILNQIIIPENLPPKINSLLSEAKGLLLKKMEYEIEVGRYNLGERSVMPLSLERDHSKVSYIIEEAKQIAQQQ